MSQKSWMNAEVFAVQHYIVDSSVRALGRAFFFVIVGLTVMQ